MSKPEWPPKRLRYSREDIAKESKWIPPVTSPKVVPVVKRERESDLAWMTDGWMQ